MKSVFYKRILLPTQDLTASVSSQATTPTPTNPVSVSYTICGNYKLYGLTNYLDTFNATTKVITHKIAIKVLDGTENWTKRSDTGVNRYQANILNDKVSGTINGLSSHFVSVLAYSQLLDGCFILDATDRVVFDKEDITTASAFKSYLSQQYSNGTPVIIYYPLATETTETATEPLQRVETKSFVQYKANPEYRNLPSGYTQVKYLESSGTQYIKLSDAGNFKIVHDIEFTDTTRSLMGYNAGGACWGSANGGNQYEGAGNDISLPTNVRRIVTYDIRQLPIMTLTIGDIVSTGLYTGSLFSQTKYRFFQINATFTARCKLYSAKVYDTNDTLINDLVPAYNSNNVAGMYDLVNNVFYTNEGTGTFIVGEDVQQFIRVDEKGFAMYQLNPNWHDLPSGYTELEYLESSGTQYINVGLTTSDYTSYEIGGTITTPVIEDNNVFLFKGLSGNSTKAKFLNGTTVIRNLVPCYNSNNVAGMYDLVNNVFYTNSGTGTFIAGNVVPKYIKYGG